MHRRASGVDMKKQIIVATFGIFMAAWFQTRSSLGRCLGLAMYHRSAPLRPMPVLRHCAKGCTISVILRRKTFYSSIVAPREIRAIFHALWLNSCNLEWISFSAQIYRRSCGQETTNTIPIVMVSNVDPVELGIVESYARPGGNITGLTLQSLELSGKRLELLKEIFPKLKRVALVWNLGDPSMNLITKQIQAAAPPLGVTLQAYGVRDANDFGGIFEKISQNPPDALFSVADRLISSQRKQILEFGVKSKIPTMFDAAPAVEAGALMAYGPSRTEVSRRAAIFVDKILKGAKPGDLPVEQPTKFELIINLKTATQIGLTIPQTVLMRADRVIK